MRRGWTRVPLLRGIYILSEHASNPVLVPAATEEQCKVWAWWDSLSVTMASVNVAVETQVMKTLDYCSTVADLS